jgi:hypothetical protein
MCVPRIPRVPAAAWVLCLATAMGCSAELTGGLPVAASEPTLTGTYTAHYPSGTSTWRIASRCESAGCFAHVISSEGWSRDAQFSATNWTLTWIDRPDGMVCPDGSTAPAFTVWSWDAQTLVGTISVAHGAACGNPPVPPGTLRAPFSLTPA